MAELALETDLTVEQREYLTTVCSSADSLLTIINDILDFSKVDAGKLQLEMLEFDLNDSVWEALRSLSVRADEKELELACDIDTNIPETLLGDPGRLRQILLNLVGNAIKFTSDGEIVVRAILDSADLNEAIIHFTVSDTGVGIPAELQGKIFESFTQADGSTTRKYGGTGLGLAICRQLIELMAGRIWVESEAGQGSTFHFTARFRVAHGKTGCTSQLESSGDLNGKSVLIVDDNLTNRMILEKMLGCWGMHPTSVESASQALQALESAHAAGGFFRLILLDVCMPEVDGFALCRQIRERYGRADSAILMLSSAMHHQHVDRCRELGISAYLNKPVGQKQLKEHLQRALSQAPAPPHRPSVPLLSPTPSMSDQPLQILLAEDNLINQKLALALLRKHGHAVTVTDNGREALRVWESGGFDLILMDLQMPEMGGMEAIAILRIQEALSGRHTPVIAMTAHAMKGDRERCLLSGFDGYVSKPVKAEILFQTIEEVVQGAASVPSSSRVDI